MSFNRVSNDTMSTSAFAPTPDNAQAMEPGPTPAVPCERYQLPPAGRISAASSTTPSDGLPASKRSEQSTVEASTRQSPRGTDSMPSQGMHEALQSDQGSALRVYVTDTEAESMICHDGSFDQFFEHVTFSQSTKASSTNDLRSIPFFVQPPPSTDILMFTESVFDPGLLIDRSWRVKHELDRIDQCFPH